MKGRLFFFVLLFVFSVFFVSAETTTTDVVLTEGEQATIGDYLRDRYGWDVYTEGGCNKDEEYTYELEYEYSPGTSYEEMCFLANYSGNPTVDGKIIESAKYVSGNEPHAVSSPCDNCFYSWDDGGWTHKCEKYDSQNKGDVTCEVVYSEPESECINCSSVDLSLGQCSNGSVFNGCGDFLYCNMGLDHTSCVNDNLVCSGPYENCDGDWTNGCEGYELDEGSCNFCRSDADGCDAAFCRVLAIEIIDVFNQEGSDYSCNGDLYNSILDTNKDNYISTTDALLAIDKLNNGLSCDELINDTNPCVDESEPVWRNLLDNVTSVIDDHESGVGIGHPDYDSNLDVNLDNRVDPDDLFIVRESIYLEQGSCEKFSNEDIVCGCDKGYANCDDDWSNGCESFDLDVGSCNFCGAEDYDDCHGSFCRELALQVIDSLDIPSYDHHCSGLDYDPFLDTSGDGYVSPIDGLLPIARMNNGESCDYLIDDDNPCLLDDDSVCADLLIELSNFLDSHSGDVDCFDGDYKDSLDINADGVITPFDLFLLRKRIYLDLGPCDSFYGRDIDCDCTPQCSFLRDDISDSMGHDCSESEYVNINDVNKDGVIDKVDKDIVQRRIDNGLCCDDLLDADYNPCEDTYWADANGFKISSGNPVDVGDAVYLYPDNYAKYKLYDKDDEPVKTLDDNRWIVDSHEDNPYTFSTVDAFSSNSLSVNSLEDSGVDDPMDVEIHSPDCGDDFSVGDTVHLSISISDSDSFVSGSAVIGGEEYELTNAQGGYNSITTSTLDSAGSVPILIELENNDGESYRHYLNIIVIDPEKEGVQKYVAACIDSPKDLEEYSENLVHFDASSSKGVIYDEGSFETVDPDDLFFDWSFFSEEEELAPCTGVGGGSCYEGSSGNCYDFKRRFPSAGRNRAVLRVSFP